VHQFGFIYKIIQGCKVALLKSQTSLLYNLQPCVSYLLDINVFLMTVQCCLWLCTLLYKLRN